MKQNRSDFAEIKPIDYIKLGNRYVAKKDYVGAGECYESAIKLSNSLNLLGHRNITYGYAMENLLIVSALNNDLRSFLMYNDKLRGIRFTNKRRKAKFNKLLTAEITKELDKPLSFLERMPKDIFLELKGRIFSYMPFFGKFNYSIYSKYKNDFEDFLKRVTNGKYASLDNLYELENILICPDANDFKPQVIEPVSVQLTSNEQKLLDDIIEAQGGSLMSADFNRVAAVVSDINKRASSKIDGEENKELEYLEGLGIIVRDNLSTLEDNEAISDKINRDLKNSNTRLKELKGIVAASEGEKAIFDIINRDLPITKKNEEYNNEFMPVIDVDTSVKEISANNTSAHSKSDLDAVNKFRLNLQKLSDEQYSYFEKKFFMRLKLRKSSYAHLSLDEILNRLEKRIKSTLKI